MPRVFISYVRENSKEVQLLANELKAHGITVWLDKTQIKPGYRWKDAIREGISEGDFFIACFSDEYSKRSKTYMNEELTLAIDELRQRPTDRAWFIPVLLSETNVPNRDIGAGETLRSIHWVELYKNWDDGVRSILSVIQPDAANVPKIEFPKLMENDWSVLLHEIMDGKCTPFLGPGTTYGVLPYDFTFAREWALKYDYSIEGPLDLAKVAQFLATKFDPMFPKGLIQDRYKNISISDFTDAEEPHGTLAELPFRVYITTNYDDFMVQALKAQRKDPKREFSRWSRYLRKMSSVFDDVMFEPTVESPVVFHVYGHTEVPESMVLTEDDYVNFLTATSRDENPLPLQIRKTLTDTSPLFIGFSLSDVKYRNLFHILEPYFKINLRRPIGQFKPEQMLRRQYLQAQDYPDYLKRYLPNSTVWWGEWVTLREFIAELRLRWKRFLSGK